MKKTLLLIVAALLTLSASVYGADGKANYDKNCAKCHGKDGRGQTMMGKKMGAKDYTDAKVQAAVTDEAMAKAICDGFVKDGKTLMKPSEELIDADVKALVAYMRQFKK